MPNQEIQKRNTQAKTPRNQKDSKEKANSHKNIKVTERFPWIGSLVKIVDELKSGLTVVNKVNTKLCSELDSLTPTSMSRLYSC